VLQSACDALAAACALPGVIAPLTHEEQKSSSVRVPTNAERAQALSLHALALHRKSDGSCSEARDVRILVAHVDSEETSQGTLRVSKNAAMFLQVVL
jgi:exo-beta-1,3-glucanase (GH17 family)